ncbi:hypothetical protein GJR96_07555 [Haloferax sp. MBLA0076]|uniref:Uncharacterized protein n=1 Tax=Haloferax litoreum TaxID=2666140 RepID=A0A6A8GG92_9EURY|nr:MULTISPECIES: hypothetical protein [Haloferax]MRX21811.1 hypothetical protein [Haloferax litoreum]
MVGDIASLSLADENAGDEIRTTVAPLTDEKAWDASLCSLSFAEASAGDEI